MHRLNPWTVPVVALALLMAATSFDAGAKRRAKRKPRALPFEIPTTLTIFSTTDGATVEIDGKKVGTVPLDEPLPIAAGQHTVRMTLRGWTEYVDTFMVQAGEETELEIDLIPAAGVVRIETARPGATVTIDGRAVGVTPFDQDVPLGKVVISVSRPGFVEQLREVQILAGKTYDLKIILVPSPTAAPPGGRVTGKWWFWTAVGAAVLGGATLVAVLAGGSDPVAPPLPHTTVPIP